MTLHPAVTVAITSHTLRQRSYPVVTETDTRYTPTIMTDDEKAILELQLEGKIT